MSQRNSGPRTEPLPLPETKISWAHAFGVIRTPSFRNFIFSYAVIITALSMQRIILAWLVLEDSGNIASVGIAISMQYLPMLLFGFAGGVVADKWSKKSVLITCQFAFFGVAVALLIFELVSSLSVVAIYVFGAVIGIIQALQLPSAQGIIGELVRPTEIPSAVSFTSSAFQGGQLIGPAAGGFLLAQFGSASAWGLNLFLVVFSLALLVRITPTPQQSQHSTKQSRSSVTVRDGFRYVGTKPTLVVVLVLLFIISICLYATPVFLTAFAEEEFNIGASGYGMLSSVMAGGALIGALLSVKRASPTMSMILIFTVILGASQILMGSLFSLGLFIGAVIMRGATSLYTTTAINAFMQLRSNTMMRGRVMSFYGIMMNAGMALGNVIIGALVAAHGVRFVMLLTGAVLIVSAVVVWLISLFMARSQTA